MSETVLNPTSEPAVIPISELLPWLVFAAVLLLAIYFVGVEEGATSIVPGRYVHEFVHDGRHLLGFPATEIQRGALWSEPSFAGGCSLASLLDFSHSATRRYLVNL
jgi:Probable cobalt transporter subunit (CbtB)